MFGKVKTVIPKLWGETGSIEPTPNFDSHVSATKPETEMGVCDAKDHNYVSKILNLAYKNISPFKPISIYFHAILRILLLL